MSEWTIYAFWAATVLLLGFGLGFTLLEFHRADKRQQEEEARARADSARGKVKGRAA